MPMFSVFYHLLSSGFLPYPLSLGLAISALVCLDFAFHLLSSVISFSWPFIYLAFAHVQTISTSSLQGILPSSTCLPLSRCLHFLHDLQCSLVIPLAHCNMCISVVCHFLSFFLTAQHFAPYIMAGLIAVLYTLSFNFVSLFISFKAFFNLVVCSGERRFCFRRTILIL